MQQQKKEKVRIFALARELGMETKDLLVICQQHGLDVKNQLSTIEPEVRDQILQLVKRSSSATAPAPQPAPAAPTPPQPTRRIVNLDQKARTVPGRSEPVRGSPPDAVPTASPAAPAASAPVPPPAPPPVAPITPQARPAPATVSPTPAPIPVLQPPMPAPVASSAPTVSAKAQTAPVAPVPTPTKSPVAAPTASVQPAAPVPPPTSVPAATLPEKQPILAEKTPEPVASMAPPAPKQPEPAPQARVQEPPAPARQAETAVSPAPKPPEARPPETSARPPETSRPQAATAPTPRPTGTTPPPSRQGGPVTGPSPGETPRPSPHVHPTGHKPLRNLGSQGGNRPGGTGQGGGGGGGNRGPGERQPPRPGGGPRSPQPGGHRLAPPPTQQPRPAAKAPEQPKTPPPTGPRKLANITAETLAGLEGRGGNISVREIEERIRRQQQSPQAAPPTTGPGAGVPPPTSDAEIDEDDDRKGGKGRRPAPTPATGGGVAGRADRHKERSERQARRKAQGNDTRGGAKSVSALLDDDSPRHRKDRRPKPQKLPGTLDRKGKIPITLPITVRSLAEAIGRKAGEVLFKLLGHGLAPTTNINSNVDAEVAELVALEFGKEVEIKRETDAEQQLIDSHDLADSPEELLPRAPVVAIMGHVDHGKTSLLDRIREQFGLKSDIVSTEAGGITQVIRAWRVEKDGKPITFLDTPGHEAFTKMRARGANVTDIAVIVVAANDGVMPQTEEAISHAKAAEVSIVVAINKVDLPDANLRKTEQMLMSLGLIPDNMGGDVPFVHTSAKTGKGIDDLLEQLSVVAELNELSANPNKPASGTCLEAHLSEKEGVQATLLIQNGTLKTGDCVLCGATFGTVRKMFDDQGKVIETAGPSVPVRILGLDEVPNADDTFHVVGDVTTAADIAAERKARLREKALKSRNPVTLESLTEAKIVELKVILKAEARGSIEAIRNELNKFYHEEVRVRVLHAGIGGISVSDVQLAMTSPEDTIIVGFNVVPDNEAKALAEERGIQIREYDIIYKLADDIRAALEGKLKPREEIIHLGRAVVRNTFKISRVGTIAGCHVTQGVMERSAKIRVIRSGVVVYPPADRTVGLESLKRFKDDVREVREGFECGLKIAGYDDIKVDDIIECYRVEQVQRTLS